MTPASALPNRIRYETSVDHASDAVWHATMAAFDDIHYEQTAIYSSGQRGESSSRMLLTANDQPIGGASVGIYSVPVMGRGLALVRFGPFWRRTGEPAAFDSYRAAIEAMIEEYCMRRRLYLVVRPRAHPDYYPLEADVLQSMGLYKADSSMLDRYFVNLQLSEVEQRKSLGQKWRYNLKAGEANGIDVQIDDSPASLAIFQAIYADMVKRKNLNYLGVDIVDELPKFSSLPQGMRLQIALAYHEGKPIGGLAFGVAGDVAYYVFGASSEQAIALHAGYVLQWSVIRLLSGRAELRWYELGGPGDPGIRQFKKGLAGKRGQMLAVQEFHYSTDAIARLVAKGFYRLRDARNIFQRWQRGA
jgi:hypothetical protein